MSRAKTLLSKHMCHTCQDKFLTFNSAYTCRLYFCTKECFLDIGCKHKTKAIVIDNHLYKSCHMLSYFLYFVIILYIGLIVLWPEPYIELYILVRTGCQVRYYLLIKIVPKFYTILVFPLPRLSQLCGRNPLCLLNSSD